jgi:arachidonate 15-lipoxygenase
MLETNTVTTRPAAIKDTNPSTGYTYNYTYLPPLAMVDALPPAEAFSARPDWIFLVARSALKILINSIMIGVKNKGDNIAFVPQVLKDLKAVAQQLKGDAGRDLSNAIAMELEKQGSPTTLPQLKAFLEGVIEPFAKTLTLETLRGIGQSLGQFRTVSGPASSLEDYDQLFQFISLPAVSQNFREDSEFAAMRVAGPNPLTIERMKALDARLPITEEQYQAVMGTHDSLETALADGRLYLADYSVFDGALNGSFPAAQKFNYAPLALFAVPPGGQSLVPVAIQCAPGPGPDNPIFLPRDGDNWLIAKTIVQIADANFHEVVSHLGRTHLFIEPFVIATHSQLSPTHPLFVLLTPHFEGTLAINDAALRALIVSRGLVDRLSASSIDQSRVFAVKAAQSYQLNINTSTLPQTLAQRGVDDTRRLPDYPYRDDALLLWGAISRWVEDYVNHYYPSDAAVQDDVELQNWVAELVAHDGGRLNNIGAANRISRRAQLVELVTLICFTASVQHAAVNYPQGATMTYTPAMSLAGYSPLSAPQEGFSEGAFLKFLPPLDSAKVQLDILYLLGSVYYTRLGDYGDDYFTDPVIQNHLAKFKQELIKIEEEINERNKTRTPYEFLLPSRIPQSINI